MTHQKSEAAVLAELRLDLSERQCRMFRNNSGVAMNSSGQPVRFGLGNESAPSNKLFKSSDLIGLTPYRIEASDVGRTVAIFTAIEAKREDWIYSGTDHERAQLNFITMVQSLGGYAGFATTPSELDFILSRENR